MRKARAAACVVALAVACDQSVTIGSRWVRQQQVTALHGGTVAVTPADSAVLAGASLRLLPGDLPADTLITLEGATSLSGEPRAAGPALAWGPASTLLVRPVLMTLPYSLSAAQSAADLIVFSPDTTGHVLRIEHGALAVDELHHLVSFEVPRLGLFQAAAVARCKQVGDCGDTGELCVSDECRVPCAALGCACSDLIGCATGLVCHGDICRPQSDGGG